MANITVVIKTNALHPGDVLIKDLGIIIPGGGGAGETFDEVEEVREIATSLYLAAFVVDDSVAAGSSTLIITDGTTDIAQDDAVNFLLSRALADGVDEFGVLRTDAAGEMDQSVVFGGGATMTNAKLANDMDADGNKIANVAAPTLGGDAANKDYVDSVASGLKWKAPVRAMSDANVASLSGLVTADGVSLGSGDRVLLTAQTAPTENGIWVVGAGAWTRPADFPVGGSASSAAMFVDQGTVYKDTAWTCTTDAGSDVIDTDALAFVQFSAQTTTHPSRLQYGVSRRVPGGGVRYLADAGGVATSAAPTIKLRAGTITAASVSVDQLDATNDYKLSIKKNGTEVGSVLMTSGNTKAINTALAIAYVANDELSVSMERTAAGPRSDFAEITATIEIRE